MTDCYRLSGLFDLPILVGVVIDSNANTSIKPILNLSSSLAPVILVLVFAVLAKQFGYL